MTARPAVSPDWGEGRFLDRWMLVHLVSGVAGGFSNVYFKLSVGGVFAVALAAMLLWEAGEYIGGVRESWTNILIDIAIGLLGVSVALGVARALDARGERIAFALTFAMALTGSVLGWIDYRRRRRLETPEGPATTR